MKSLAILLLWICYLAVCLTCDITQGQMPTAPARLMPRNSILLVETPNAEKLINHLKRDYHDQFYRWAISEGKMQPLDLTAPRYRLITSKIENSHWLTTSVDSLRQRSLPSAKALLSSLKPFEQNSSQISPDEEDEIVANLARLFPGRMFMGLENHAPNCTVVFGFEFEPTTFDWFEELKATAKVQNGNAMAAGSAAGLPIFHLPLEEIYFFSVDNVVYGASDISIDSCVELAGRVMNVPEQEDSLAGSRHFARVSSSLDYESDDFDVYCFARVEDFTKLKIRGGLDPDTGTREIVDEDMRWSDDLQFWGNDVGVSVNFDVEGNIFKYRVVWPLIAPTDSMVVELFERALKTIDPKKLRVLPPFLQSSFTRVGDMSKFPGFRTYSAQGFGFFAMACHQLYDSGFEEGIEEQDLMYQLLEELDNALKVIPETCMFYSMPEEYFGVFFDGSLATDSLDEFEGSLMGILDPEVLAKEREQFKAASKHRVDVASAGQLRI